MTFPNKTQILSADKNFLRLFMVFMAVMVTGWLTSTPVRAENELSEQLPVGPMTLEMAPVTQEELEQALQSRQQAVAADLASQSPVTDVPGQLTMAAQMRSIEARPAEIDELARALRHDPDLIYEYVRNRIEYEPLFGLKKGALGALTDQRGTAFDQSALMVELLRASGYNAWYVYGKIQPAPAQLVSWTGAASLQGAVNVLANGGIPVNWYARDKVKVTHVWVKVEMAGQVYAFDPAFKQHKIHSGVDVAALSGFSTHSFMSNALAGASITGNYVQNINHTAVRNQLNQLASHFASQVQQHYPEFSVAEVIGKKELQPDETQHRQNALPYQLEISEEWRGQIPGRYETRLRVQLLGINKLFSSKDIYGQRLTIRFNNTNQPELRLNGALLATGNAAVRNSTQKVGFSITHPYRSNGANQSREQEIQATPGYTYLIANGWGMMGKGMLVKHQKQLLEMRQAGKSLSSEAVLGENLMLIASHWIIQNSQSDEILGAVTGSAKLRHHWVGIAGHKTGPYVDLPLNVVASVRLDSGQNDNVSLFVSAGTSSALEHSVIEQTQAVKAVSTVQLLDYANQQSNRIYDVTRQNFASIRPLLTGYSSRELNDFQNTFLNRGYRILLPENGSLKQDAGNSWQGYGALIISKNEGQITHLIGGGLKGGFSRLPVPPRNYLPPVTLPKITNAQSVATGQTSYDPIDLVTGDFLYDKTDLTVGSQTFPVGLGFERHYSSAGRLNKRTLGYGWTHSYDITAKQESNAYQGLGEDSAIDAAAVIVANYISYNIVQGEKTKEKLLVQAIIQKWMMDQLQDNAVNIHAPGNTRQFIKLANGHYNPPPASQSQLQRLADGRYRLTDKHGIVMEFDAKGRLKYRTDPNGNKVTLSYNANGQLASVQNDFKQRLNLHYRNKNIDWVSDQNGRKVKYQYDAQHNLTRFIDTAGQVTDYQYDLTGRLTQVYTPAHPDSPAVTNYYDSRDKVESQTNGDGYTYDYYFSGYRNEEVDPAGHSKIYYYSLFGKPLRTVDALGREVMTTYNGQQQVKTRTFPEGNRIEYRYDQAHRISQIITHPKPGSSLEALSHHYQYEDTYNKLSRSTDPLGRSTRFQYDQNGNLTAIRYPTVQGETPQVTYQYDTHGFRISETDAEGRQNQFSYDASGNMVQSIQDPSGIKLITDYGYDKTGNLISQTDPKNHTTVFQYDTERRLIKRTDPEPFNTVTEYDYDAEGQLREKRRQTDDSLNPWQITRFQYNRNGQVLTVIDPQAHETRYTYDGNNRLITRIDAENRLTDTLYDAAGQIIETRKLLNEVPVTVARYQYTANGQKKTVTDGEGHTTRYQYDGHDRLAKIHYADGSYEQWQYDKAGNILQRKDRSGRRFTYRYDALNRLVQKLRPDGGQVDYGYDLSGIQTQIVENTHRWQYQTDRLGRLIEATQPSGERIQYHYDANHNRTAIVYPDGFTVNYQYDALNRLDKIQQNGTTLAQYQYDALSRRTEIRYGNGVKTQYRYEVDNDLAQIHTTLKETQVKFDYQYNAVSQLTQKLQDYGSRYKYRVNRQQRWLRKLYRLTFLNSDKLEENYQNNPLNQYQSLSGSRTYDYRGHLRTYHVTPQTYHYDANGNLTQVLRRQTAVVTYQYDIENRLIDIHRNGQHYQYQYDPQGCRITTHEPGKTVWHYNAQQRKWQQTRTADRIIHYSYDGNRVLTEKDDQGRLLKRYIYADGVDEPLMMMSWTIRGQYRNVTQPYSVYYHQDRTGSIAHLSWDNNFAKGRLYNVYQYDVFGRSLYRQDAIDNPYRFAGRRYDKETGLYYNRARYYDPVLGRFLQPDPLGYADGLNLYAYVGNDPLNLTDPSGLLGKRLSNRYSLNKTAVDFALGLTPLGGLGEAYYAAQAGDYTAAAIAAVQELPVGKVYKIGSNIAGVVRGVGKSVGNGASNINAQAALRAKLSRVEKAQQSAAQTRQLGDGRIRYYTNEVSARTQGPTRQEAHLLLRSIIQKQGKYASGWRATTTQVESIVFIPNHLMVKH